MTDASAVGYRVTAASIEYSAMGLSYRARYPNLTVCNNRLYSILAANESKGNPEGLSDGQTNVISACQGVGYETRQD